MDNVNDVAPDAAASVYDKYKDIKQGQTTGNYAYDEIGNLVIDKAGDIYDRTTPTKRQIDWTVYGKIQEVRKADGTKISYTYDAGGQRISKTVFSPTAGTETTIYTRDATGNTMSVYVAKGVTAPVQTEIAMYGSSRLGMATTHAAAPTSLPLLGGFGTATITTFTVGEKLFELSNHLGNVLATVSDKRLQVSSNGTTLNYFTADVVNITDYYVFGMAMPGRSFSAGNVYRYGFNGKENDKDISNGAVAFEARIYDNRLGRFLSTDLRESEYAWQSTYAYFSNSPIRQLDFNGEGGDEKQKVKAYTNSDIKKYERSIAANQKKFQETSLKYTEYYKKIGKIKANASESDIQNVLSAGEKGELNRLNTLGTTLKNNLNHEKAVEVQWNKLDKDIEGVTDDFNKRKGFTGNQRLDPNLVKAVMFSETEMGEGADYKKLIALFSSDIFTYGNAMYQLNLGRVTTLAIYDAVTAEFNFSVNKFANYKALGNKNDVMLSAGELIYEFRYAKTVKNPYFKAGMPWFNAVVAYKGASAKGASNAEKAWKLFTTGVHPYTSGIQLFVK